MPTRFEVLGQAEFKSFIGDLRRLSNGAQLRRNLAKELRQIGRPVIRDVQDAVRTLDVTGVGLNRPKAKPKPKAKKEPQKPKPPAVKGGGRRGSDLRTFVYAHKHPKGRLSNHALRATVARGVKLSVTTSGSSVGLKIYIDRKVMPNQQRRLPEHLDNPSGWRHPVWGNRDVWVTERGGPYFSRTIARHTPAVRQAVIDAVNNTLKELQ